MRASVVVPTYNEAGNIVETLERLSLILGDIGHEIIVVDDDSEDQTWRIARDHADAYPNVHVIRRVHEKGLASAVLCGMAASTGDTLAVIDADHQHDEAILPAMLEAVLGDRAELCVAVRSDTQPRPPARRAATALGTLCAQALVPGLRLTADPLSGYFALTRGLYERARPPQQHTLRSYKVLWTFLAADPAPSVAGIDYCFDRRRHGDSKLTSGVLADDLAVAAAMRVGHGADPAGVKRCAAAATAAAAAAAVALAPRPLTAAAIAGQAAATAARLAYTYPGNRPAAARAAAAAAGIAYLCAGARQHRAAAAVAAGVAAVAATAPSQTGSAAPARSLLWLRSRRASKGRTTWPESPISSDTAPNTTIPRRCEESSSSTPPRSCSSNAASPTPTWVTSPSGPASPG